MRRSVGSLAALALLWLGAASALGASGLRLKVAFDGHGSGHQHAQMDGSCPGPDYSNNHCWYGGADEYANFNSWHAAFAPIPFDGASNLGQADPASTSLDWTTRNVSHYWQDGSGSDIDCTAHATAPDLGASSLQLLVTNSAGSLHINAEAPYQPDPASVQLSGQCSNPYGFPPLAPSLQQLLTAVADVPLQRVMRGPVDVPVSSSDPGVAQLPGDCTSAAQYGTAECDRVLSWSGTLHLEVVCDPAAAEGKISLSEGDAPPVGTAVCDGSVLKTGPRSRLEVTLKDGSLLREGADSEVKLGPASFAPDDRRFSANVVLGNIWAKVNEAVGRHGEFEVTTTRAIAGVRGSAVTATVLPGGYYRVLYHAVEGTGFVRLKGKPEVDYPAGEGIILTDDGFSYTRRWPRAARALVPAADLPPTAVASRLTGSGAGTVLHVRLDQAASLRLIVLQGKRVISSIQVSGRRGANTLHPLRRSLARGRYELQVIAANVRRDTSITSIPFSVG